MEDRRRPLFDALIAALGVEKAALPAEIRRNLMAGKPLTGALGALAIRVQENASRITDEQVEALTAAGVPDDEIFECVIAAAMGAGMERLRRVRELLGVPL